jgi:hypothetical protein
LHQVLLELWFSAHLRVDDELEQMRRMGAQEQLLKPEQTVPEALIDHFTREAATGVKRAARLLKDVPDDELAFHRHEIVAFFRESGRKLRFSVTDRASLRAFSEVIGQRATTQLGAGRPVLVEIEREAVLPLEDAAASIRSFLRNRVTYLGPLREEPQVVYSPGAPAAAGFLGTKGEYTAAVLHTLADQVIDCPMPRGGSRPQRLRESVSMWLSHLRIAESIETGSLGRPGLELKIREAGSTRPRDLTSVGVGVSQLVPVVVACLIARPESLVLLEQPELHLHPALQQGLADFLLRCSEADRQLIVETHSDHLVSRLRYRIAADTTEGLLDRLAFLHVEKDSAGRTSFTSVKPNQFGGFDAWPAGFFDQSAEESRRILNAAVAKRSRGETAVRGARGRRRSN